MPAFTSDSKKDLLRLQMYGPSATKKTWFAGTAAEAGFNVVIIATEPGTKILRQLSAEAQERVYVIDVQDTQTSAVASLFCTLFLNGKSFNWEESTKTAVAKPTETSIHIDTSRFDKNTFVYIDSYSALTWSLAFRYSIDNMIDLGDAQKADWDGYNYTGRLATWMVQQLVKLPCHIGLIGHQQVYEKRSKDGKKVEWQRTQMKSTSGPHAMTIAQEFDEVMYFTMVGKATKIDLSAVADRDGGGRVLEPKTYSWKDLSVKVICEMAGIQLPLKDLPLPIEYFSAPVPKTASAAVKKGAKVQKEIRTGVGSRVFSKT